MDDSMTNENEDEDDNEDDNEGEGDGEGENRKDEKEEEDREDVDNMESSGDDDRVSVSYRRSNIQTEDDLTRWKGEREIAVL